MIYGRIIQRAESEEKANYEDTVQKSEENLPNLKTQAIVMAESARQSPDSNFSTSNSASVVKFLVNLQSRNVERRLSAHESVILEVIHGRSEL